MSVTASVVVLSQDYMFTSGSVPIKCNVGSVVNSCVLFARLKGASFPFTTIVPVVRFRVVIHTIRLTTFRIIVRRDIIRGVAIFNA